MKTIIGFICGIVGMILACAIFISGMMAGYALAKQKEENHELETEN